MTLEAAVKMGTHFYLGWLADEGIFLARIIYHNSNDQRDISCRSSTLIGALRNLETLIECGGT